MKIVHVVPGSGGTFYCQNCLRDAALVAALRRLGHDVVLAPMYLPLFGTEPGAHGAAPVFYGAVNVYLKERIPLFRRAPEWLEKLLDAPTLLGWAARKAGSTRAAGLEDMTISVLRGTEGRQAAELERMLEWLVQEGDIDVVHLSNALLLGLAAPIRAATGARIVCSLQDEDQWVDTMQADYSAPVWALMAEKAAAVDLFTPVSASYADAVRERLRLPPERLHTVPIGIDTSGLEPVSPPLDTPVIGFLSRLSEACGLGVLVDAFIAIKRAGTVPGLRLRATGGLTGDDRHFVRGLRKRLAAAGFLDDVDFVTEFAPDQRAAFLQSLSVLSVPVLRGEAFGTYLLEALACGVPTVQPALGAFPELAAATRGGLIYGPNTPEALAAALTSLLCDPARRAELGRNGRATVLDEYRVERMAQRMADLYKAIP